MKKSKVIEIIHDEILKALEEDNVYGKYAQNDCEKLAMALKGSKNIKDVLNVKITQTGAKCTVITTDSKRFEVSIKPLNDHTVDKLVYEQ